MDYERLKTPAERAAYYADQGYVVVHSVLSTDACDAVLAAFRQEVKPYSGYIYRQASANPERHVWTDAGTMLNSILNPIAVDPNKFPTFRAACTRALTSSALFERAAELLGEPAGLVQSMYFEGNPATWAHQDCYYLDSVRQGALMGAWIALEDIDPRSGQFYVYPRSQNLELLPNEGATSIAYNHDAYKTHVLNEIARNGLEASAPRLRKGDVLYWGSRVIHGAYDAEDHAFSRNSLTAHFIPLTEKLLQYQRRALDIPWESVNGCAVYRPKDQARSVNRLRMRLETTFPGPFQWLKRRAVAAILR